MVTNKKLQNNPPRLFSKARSSILALLYTNPSHQYYFHEIVRLTGLGVGPADRELAKLVRMRLVGREKRGNQVYYSALDNPIFNELRAIIAKTAGGPEAIKNALKPLRKKISEAYIYGSFARGDVWHDSDIDVMVIGSASLQEVIDVLLPVMEKLRREINPTVISEQEYKTKVDKGHYFFASVDSSERIQLIGRDHDT